jgi:hypothetical protein
MRVPELFTIYREYRPMVVWWCGGVAKGVKH